jgi:hypothetical protein
MEFLFQAPLLHELPYFCEEVDIYCLQGTCKAGQLAEFRNPVLILLPPANPIVFSHHNELRIGYSPKAKDCDGVNILRRLRGHFRQIETLIIHFSDEASTMSELIRTVASLFPRLKSLSITRKHHQVAEDRFELDPFWERCKLNDLQLDLYTYTPWAMDEQINVIAQKLLTRSNPRMKRFKCHKDYHHILPDTMRLLATTERLWVPWDAEDCRVLLQRCSASLKHLHLSSLASLTVPAAPYPRIIVVENVLHMCPRLFRLHLENNVTTSFTFLDYEDRHPFEFMKCVAVLALRREFLSHSMVEVLELADKKNVAVTWNLQPTTFKTRYASRCTWSFVYDRVTVSNRLVCLWRVAGAVASHRDSEKTPHGLTSCVKNVFCRSRTYLQSGSFLLFPTLT